MYEDIASKFFEHFIGITDAMNALGGSGLWDEEDGFSYERLQFVDADGLNALLNRFAPGFDDTFNVESRTRTLERTPAAMNISSESEALLALSVVAEFRR